MAETTSIRRRPPACTKMTRSSPRANRRSVPGAPVREGAEETREERPGQS